MKVAVPVSMQHCFLLKIFITLEKILIPVMIAGFIFIVSLYIGIDIFLYKFPESGYLFVINFI